MSTTITIAAICPACRDAIVYITAGSQTRKCKDCKERTMGASGWVHIEVEKIVRETDKAFLCRIAEVGDVWLPKSQISEWENYEEGDADCTISITEFIAREKELEGY